MGIAGHKRCSCRKSPQQCHGLLVCCKAALVLNWLLTMILKGFNKQLFQGRADVYQIKEHVLCGFGSCQLYWMCPWLQWLTGPGVGAEQELLLQNGSDWSLPCPEQSSCEIPALTAQGSLNSQLASHRNWGHFPGLCRVFQVANSPEVSIPHGMHSGIAPLIPGRGTASGA